MHDTGRAVAKSHSEFSAIARDGFAPFTLSSRSGVGRGGLLYRCVAVGRRSTLRPETAKILCVEFRPFPACSSPRMAVEAEASNPSHAGAGARRASWAVSLRSRTAFGLFTKAGTGHTFACSSGTECSLEPPSSRPPRHPLRLVLACSRSRGEMATPRRPFLRRGLVVVEHPSFNSRLTRRSSRPATAGAVRPV